jgi:hypothetical protein
MAKAALVNPSARWLHLPGLRPDADRHLPAACDHIEPHRGDVAKFWAGPFRTLCSTCHNSHKQSEEKTGRKRLQTGIDGWPE